jgi:hypothetical protein
MTVFVDEIRRYPKESIKRPAKRWGHKWSHMWADGPVDELHAMAAKIGLKRAWFQDKPRHPHYDVIPSKRALAIRYGAIEMCYAEWYKKVRKECANV